MHMIGHDDVGMKSITRSPNGRDARWPSPAGGTGILPVAHVRAPPNGRDARWPCMPFAVGVKELKCFLDHPPTSHVGQNAGPMSGIQPFVDLVSNDTPPFTESHLIPRFWMAHEPITFPFFKFCELHIRERIRQAKGDAHQRGVLPNVRIVAAMRSSRRKRRRIMSFRIGARTRKLTNGSGSPTAPQRARRPWAQMGDSDTWTHPFNIEAGEES